MSSFWSSSTSEYRFLGTKLTIDSYSFDSSTPPPNSERAIYCGQNSGWWCNAKSGPTQNRSPGLKLAAKNCPGPQLATEFSLGGLNMAARCGPLCQI